MVDSDRHESLIRKAEMFILKMLFKSTIFLLVFILLGNISYIMPVLAADDSLDQEQTMHHPEGQQQVDYRTPQRVYEEVHVSDWPVFVELALFQTQLPIANQALARLEDKLRLAMQVLPPDTQSDFRALTFYLMGGGLRPDGKPINGLEFCAPDAPDFHARLDPRWRKCIVIHSADNYVHLSDFWALKALVHEFSHAHHLLHWPENQPDILGAWKNAVNSGLYTNVQTLDGKIIPKAYALTNQLEYFAELSCIYFIGCNYFPFNRVNLESYDPVGYVMIRKMWGISG